MKAKAILSALFIFIFCVTPAFAKIWRVDNNATILNAGDFTTLQKAVDAAADGDTIYVFGSSTTYEGITLSKKFSIFGPGFFLNENPGTSVRLVSAQIYQNGLTFDTGSEGSFISGLHFPSDINIKVNNIIIKRNLVNTITLSKDISNINILQNYINGDINVGENNNNIIISNNSGRNINIGAKNNDILISNNNLNSINSGSISSILIITNNLIYSGINVYNSTLDNNILCAGNFTGTGNSYRNNLGNSTQFGTLDGNQSSIDVSKVCIDTGSTDGKKKLAVNSPALKAGTGGTDIGMFGGSNPYVLSGIPEIPLIYYFTGSATGSETRGLEIHLKGKSVR